MLPAVRHRVRPAQSRAARASLQLLDIDLQLAAAGQPDLPGLFVGDAEIEQARLAVGNGLLRLLDDGALDAAARHRADHGAVAVDGEMAADRSGRRAPGR